MLATGITVYDIAAPTFYHRTLTVQWTPCSLGIYASLGGPFAILTQHYFRLNLEVFECFLSEVHVIYFEFKQFLQYFDNISKKHSKLQSVFWRFSYHGSNHYLFRVTNMVTKCRLLSQSVWPDVSLTKFVILQWIARLHCSLVQISINTRRYKH